MHYYNEFNPESAAMLRDMMQAGLIPHGDIDERSITEVKAHELRKYKQCHFFAGIGGWAFALGLAGQSDRSGIWTGSCPCQPFSSAGRQAGKADDRHLWPVWQSLVSECRPAKIFGEQVATAIAHGWLDDVYDGLEAQGYAVGSAVLPACSVGSPHKRDRLWFVAHTQCNASDIRPEFNLQRRRKKDAEQTWMGGSKHSLAYSDCYGCDQAGQSDTKAERNWIDGNGLFVVNAQQSGLERHPWHDGATQGRQEPQRSIASSGFWNDGQWIDCPDGKTRLVKSGIPLLVNGFQHRKPILHAIGNAIVPQLAAEFIKASS